MTTWAPSTLATRVRALCTLRGARPMRTRRPPPACLPARLPARPPACRFLSPLCCCQLAHRASAPSHSPPSLLSFSALLCRRVHHDRAGRACQGGGKPKGRGAKTPLAARPLLAALRSLPGPRACLCWGGSVRSRALRCCGPRRRLLRPPGVARPPRTLRLRAALLLLLLLVQLVFVENTLPAPSRCPSHLTLPSCSCCCSWCSLCLWRTPLTTPPAASLTSPRSRRVSLGGPAGGSGSRGGCSHTGGCARPRAPRPRACR